jgi:hypothetical protein
MVRRACCSGLGRRVNTSLVWGRDTCLLARTRPSILRDDATADEMEMQRIDVEIRPRTFGSGRAPLVWHVRPT